MSFLTVPVSVMKSGVMKFSRMEEFQSTTLYAVA